MQNRSSITKFEGGALIAIAVLMLVVYASPFANVLFIRMVAALISLCATVTSATLFNDKWYRGDVVGIFVTVLFVLLTAINMMLLSIVP